MRKIIFAAVNSALLVVFLTACIPQTDIHQDAPTQVTVPSESAYQTEQVYQEITVEPTQSVSTVKQAMYISAYQEFVSHRLETVLSPEKLSYILHDVNGDGVEELVISGLDILSMKGGQSFKYFDLTNTGVIPCRFQPCEGNVFEVYCEDLGMYQHYFYQANQESASFITGVSRDPSDGMWYLHSKDGAYTENRQQITQEEAQNILDSYTRVKFRWLPLKQFGKASESMEYSDPYAQYIADALVRYDNVDTFAYALLDLNGDNIDELITSQPRSGQGAASLQIFTLQDGERKLYASNISYICTDGILEECEEGQTDPGQYYAFYRCGTSDPEFIEKIVRDPITLYWGRVEAGKDGRTITEEEAMSVINSYQQIELDWKPFTQYPLK
ncbi:MAG: hypothetical protein MSS60_05235 [Clostridiales bacterium]|nr:hypothetical protein [Clostridiales bacterium]